MSNLETQPMDMDDLDNLASGLPEETPAAELVLLLRETCCVRFVQGLHL